MAEVTGFTAERMQQIEDESVIDGLVVGDDLVLTRRDGTPINAGSVRGPQGIQGLPGQPVGAAGGDLGGEFPNPIVRASSQTFELLFQNPALAFLGDVDQAKWIARLGGFELTLASDHDNGNSLGSGDTNAYGRVFKPKIAFRYDGAIITAGMMWPIAGHRFQADLWHNSSDDAARLYFGYGTHSYYKSPSKHLFRNNSDQDVFEIWSDGKVILHNYMYSDLSLVLRMGEGYPKASQQEFFQMWNATDGQDWSIYRPAGTRDLEFYSSLVGMAMRLKQNGEVQIQKNLFINNYLMLEATGETVVNLHTSDSATDRKRSRLRNVAGSTRLESLNDAWNAIVKSGFEFDHGSGNVYFPNGLTTPSPTLSDDSTKVATTEFVKDAIAAALAVSGGTPVGTPIPWLVSTIPTGFREFDGSAIVQATHPQLYALYGATLPDLRGKFLLGADGSHAVGTTGGAFSVALTGGQMPAHNHSLPSKYTFDPHNHTGGGVAEGPAPNGGYGSTQYTSTEGSGSAHENTPPYRAVRWITAAA